MEFKVGQLVYYINNGEKVYCVIQKIINDEIWGRWCRNKRDAIDNRSNPDLGYMHECDVFLLNEQLPFIYTLRI